MAKKLILIIASLFGVLILGLIFMSMNQGLTDDLSLSEPPNLDNSITRLSTSKEIDDINAGGVRMREMKDFIWRQPGRLEFGFLERAHKTEGKVQILDTWVKLFSNNNIVRITADKGIIPMEGNNDFLTQKMPNEGILEGNVTIEVFRKPTDVSYDDFDYDPKQKELVVKLGRTKFEREFSRIVGEGSVKVIAHEFVATGEDLIMQYDQINKKLQLLEIAQMQKLSIAVKKDNSSLQNPGDQGQNNDETDNQDVPVGPKEFMTYNLNLSDNILIQTDDGTFTADNLSIMADISSGRDIIQKTNEASEDSSQGTFIANNSFDRENRRMITMTCSGPLVITSPEKSFISENGMPRLKMTAEGRPVEIYRNGEPALKCDLLVYEQNTDGNNNHLIKLISNEQFDSIFLAQDNQRSVTASKEIKYDFNTNIATLLGPGKIRSLVNRSNQSNIDFKDMIKVKFLGQQTENDLNIKLTSNAKVEWIECLGTVEAKIEERLISADKVRINFYNQPETETETEPSETAPKDSVPAIENMIMTGNVVMKDNQSVFRCGKLITRFRNYQDQSELQSLWASNNIKIETDKYLIDISDRMMVNFGVTKQASTKTDQENDSSETAFSGVSTMFENLNPIYVLAEGANNKVLFKDKVKGNIVRGTTIEGQLPDETANVENISIASSKDLSNDGIWNISGLPAVVEIGENVVSGKNIELDQQNGFCSIAGPGDSILSASGDITGQRMTENIPMTISWQNGIIWDTQNGIVMLKQATFEFDQLASDTIMQNSKLYADNVDITLAVKEISDTGKPIHELKSFRAYGPNLRLINNEIDLINNDLVSQSQMSASQILFEAIPHGRLIASGGGWLEHIVLCKPDSTVPSEAEIAMNNGAVSNDRYEPGYYFLQFSKAMDIDMQAMDLTFADPIAIHYLPLKNGQKDIAHLGDSISLPAGGRRLYCDSLKLVNSETDKLETMQEFSKISGNDDIAESVGFGQLGYFYAKGNIFLELIDNNNEKHAFTAESLLYDRYQEKFSIGGADNNPASFDNVRFEYLNYDLENGNSSGKIYGTAKISALN